MEKVPGGDNYVMDGVTKWIHAWKKNGWKTADKKPVKNDDLWKKLDEAASKHVIDVLIWPDSASVTTPAAQSIRGFHLRHWTQSGMSFWAVSDLNDAELDQFVAALRQ